MSVMMGTLNVSFTRFRMLQGDGAKVSMRLGLRAAKEADPCPAAKGGPQFPKFSEVALFQPRTYRTGLIGVCHVKQAAAGCAWPQGIKRSMHSRCTAGAQQVQHVAFNERWENMQAWCHSIEQLQGRHSLCCLIASFA